MNIPCVERLPFLVIGLSFLQPALTAIQLNNLTLIATALVLGGKLSLTQINLMWLKAYVAQGKINSVLYHGLCQMPSLQHGK